MLSRADKVVDASTVFCPQWRQFDACRSSSSPEHLRIFKRSWDVHLRFHHGVYNAHDPLPEFICLFDFPIPPMAVDVFSSLFSNDHGSGPKGTSSCGSIPLKRSFRNLLASIASLVDGFARIELVANVVTLPCQGNLVNCSLAHHPHD